MAFCSSRDFIAFCKDISSTPKYSSVSLSMHQKLMHQILRKLHVRVHPTYISGFCYWFVGVKAIVLLNTPALYAQKNSYLRVWHVVGLLHKSSSCRVALKISILCSFIFKNRTGARKRLDTRRHRPPNGR